MRSLSAGIRSCNRRSGLNQAKAPLTKEPPTLSRSQGHSIGSLDVGCQRLSVPQIAAQAKVRRAFSQRALDRRDLLRSQPGRASTTRPLLQPGQALRLEAVNPIFDRSRSITQQFGNTTTADPLRDQQHTVQPVVIARFCTSSNFILQTKNNYRRLSNRQCFHVLHESTLPYYSQLLMTARIVSFKVPREKELT
jgi:hypothetical protein